MINPSRNPTPHLLAPRRAAAGADGAITADRVPDRGVVHAAVRASAARGRSRRFRSAAGRRALGGRRGGRGVLELLLGAEERSSTALRRSSLSTSARIAPRSRSGSAGRTVALLLLAAQAVGGVAQVLGGGLAGPSGPSCRRSRCRAVAVRRQALVGVARGLDGRHGRCRAGPRPRSAAARTGSRRLTAPRRAPAAPGRCSSPSVNLSSSLRVSASARAYTRDAEPAAALATISDRHLERLLDPVDVDELELRRARARGSRGSRPRCGPGRSPA